MITNIKLTKIKASELDIENIKYCEKKYNLKRANTEEYSVYILEIYLSESLPMTETPACKFYIGDEKIVKWAGFSDSLEVFAIRTKIISLQLVNLNAFIAFKSCGEKIISRFTLSDALNN